MGQETWVSALVDLSRVDEEVREGNVQDLFLVPSTEACEALWNGEMLGLGFLLLTQGKQALSINQGVFVEVL